MPESPPNSTLDPSTEEEVLPPDELALTLRPINEIWEADPTTLEAADFQRIVTEMRAARLKWATEDSSATAQSRRVKPSEGLNLSLKELDIDPADLQDLLKDD